MREKQVKDALSKKFVKCDEFASLLWLGFTTGKNVIFWGPGGHGKSEMAKEFFDAFNIKAPELFIQALGDGTTEDHLLGGLDMKAFKEEGKIQYLVENSFMASEYVIFEELLDCPSQVLLRLKDILTSGWFRNGTQQYQIKTKFIVCLTNRSREEVSEDRSVQALMERFPLELNVIWNSYEAKDYSMMFKKVLGKDYPVLAETIAECNKTAIISPRTAIHAAHVYDTGGFGALKHIAGFDPKIIKQLQLKEQEILKDYAVTESIKNATEFADELIAKKAQCTTIEQCLTLAADLEYMHSVYSTMSVKDKQITLLATLLNKLKAEFDGIKANVGKGITADKSTTELIDELFVNGKLSSKENKATKELSDPVGG